MSDASDPSRPPVDDHGRLDADERAAVRAYLQRTEVRLSTLHRVATALLSGAGLVVLLPAIERDSVVGVLRALITDLDLVNGLLAGATVLVLALPLVALWLLLRELTRFYFHAQHLGGAASSVFVPRFTLTGLRIPSDELAPATAERLHEVRRDPRNVELLVPAKDATRRRIDRQLAAYPGIARDLGEADAGRAAALSDLVASRDRPLLEEVAKVEHGLSRHLLRLQAIVLRYVKALLAFLTTAIAVFTGAAVVGGAADGVPELSGSQQAWLASVVLVWAPCIVYVVSTPVRWVEQLLRMEGASHTTVAADPELTQVERVSVWIAASGWLLGAVAAVVIVLDPAIEAPNEGAGVAFVAVTAVAMAATLGGRARGRRTRRSRG